MGLKVTLLSVGIGVQFCRTDLGGELLMGVLVGFPDDLGLLPCSCCWFDEGVNGDGFEFGAVPSLLLATGACWMVARVRRFSACGCNSRGTKFVREDFRRPPSTKDVGPSTAILFHGGETGLEVEGRGVAESVSFRFLVGGASSSLASLLRVRFCKDFSRVKESVVGTCAVFDGGGGSVES